MEIVAFFAATALLLAGLRGQVHAVDATLPVFHFEPRFEFARPLWIHVSDALDGRLSRLWHGQTFRHVDSLLRST